MTLHTLGVFLLNLAPIVVGLLIYLLWIRPTIRNLPHLRAFYDEADSRWQRFFVWARVQWDIIVAGVIYAVPQIPDILTQLQLIDMTPCIPRDKQKMWKSGIALAMLAFRAFNIKKTS